MQLSILRNYGRGFGGDPAMIQFVDRLGNPAPIDTSTKPLRVELEDTEIALSRGAFRNIAAAGDPGEFEFDFETLGVGGITGAFVADADMTPEGEKELRVPFAIVIAAGEAEGAAIQFGGGADKTPASPA